jgi:hypothetical protein
VRITTRSEVGRAAIEQTGAECWIGTPDRLATLRAALDGVTILCWLLGTATGTTEELDALYGDRLRFFLTQAIDTTVRGFIYEPPAVGERRRPGRGPVAGGRVALGEPHALGEHQGGGEDIVRELTERNAIPVAFLSADPADLATWLSQARGVIASLLAGA